MRGRNRTKGPNPLTRSYESNGPDVKIRGTAQHVADKYAQLARDAQASGDPVAAENYLQHAEHYYRLIAAAQEQFRQQYGQFQRPFDEDGEDGDEEMPAGGGFGHPAERIQADEFGEGGYPPPYAPSDRGPADRGAPPPRFDRGQDRGDRQDRGPERQDRGDRGQRFDRGPDRERGSYDRPDRGGERQDFRGDRQDYRGDRPDRGDRQDRGPVDRGPDRAAQDRGPHDRGPQDRGGPDRGGGQDRRERFGRNDNGRGDAGRPDGSRGENGRGDGRRDFPRPERQPRPDAPRFPQVDEPAIEVAALPAFLMNPVRPPVAVSGADGADLAPLPAYTETDEPRPEVEAGLNGARPRRRRVRRTEGGSDTAGEPAAAPTDSPVE